ncbi:MAG: BrnT family toxin [Chlamydiae bacterium]|nr:BrnT family toxin [Chlamydiota bacterium]MBI3265837.1 BrnT family toxin [Chlamydiota bacterium]
MDVFSKPIRFEWDSGNREKNFLKHSVTCEECEEVFFDPHKRILKEILYAGKEKRFLLMGRSKALRSLFIVFTVRGRRIRIISARDLNRKERGL